MAKDINDLTMDIMMNAASQDLTKALPPRIAYRLRRWFQRQGRRVKIAGPQEIAAQVAHKMEQAMAAKELRKNQFMTRVHDDGVVRMDFGSAVPEPVRKAAMEWAKRRGLKAMEASLVKQETAPFSITYTSGRQPSASQQLVAQYVWEIQE
jgi:hypothetical protein